MSECDFQSVESIAEELRNEGHVWYADRILASYKRDIETLGWKIENYEQVLSAKDREMRGLRTLLSSVQDITGDCRKCEECGDASCPWFGEPDGCNNREGRAKFLSGEMTSPMASRDATIKELDSEIASLRSLAKELTEALNHRIDCECDCDGCTMPKCTNKRCRELVAKARESLS